MTEFRSTKSISCRVCAHAGVPCCPCAMRSQQRAGTGSANAFTANFQRHKRQLGPLPSSGPRLTLADAERMAIEHNPNISVARLHSVGAGASDARSAVRRDAHGDGSLTAVGAHKTAASPLAFSTILRSTIAPRAA